MKLDALDHPKTLDLAARLNAELPTVIGHLELLWAFTGKKAPQGNIGKWPDGAIARACYWMGRPEVFILALLESGFIDSDDEHRLTIHDWQEHAPRWVKSKLKTLGLSFVDAVSRDAARDVSPNVSADSKGREGKTSEVKGSEERVQAPEPTPDGLDLNAWTAWTVYRKQIGKPVKPASIPAAQRKLAAHGTSQAAVVEQSIANGWQGLFELKTSTPGRQQPTKFERAKQALGETQDVGFG